MKPRLSVLPCLLVLVSALCAVAGAADKPVKKEISAHIEIVPFQEDSKVNGKICHISPQLRFSAVKGAASYEVSYYDAHHRRTETRILTSPPGSVNPNFPVFTPPKGSYWVALAGAASGGTCGENGAVTIQQYAARFSKAEVFAIFEKQGFLLAGHVTDETGEPMVGTRLLIVGKDERTAVTTGSDGAYGALLPKGTYAVGTGVKDDLKPVESGDCEVVGKEKNCQVNLNRDRRKVDFEIEAPAALAITAKLRARVRGEHKRDWIRAGTAFLIGLTLKNKSQDRLVVDFPPETSAFVKLAGNAYDGRVQPFGTPVRAPAPDAKRASAVSPVIVLAPKATRELDIVVRTRAYDVKRLEPEAKVKPDGTIVFNDRPRVSTVAPARVTIASLPRVGKAPKQGPLDEDKIEWLTAKDVDLELEGEGVKGSRAFEFTVDDTQPQDDYPFHEFADDANIGVAQGLEKIWWGASDGIWGALNFVSEGSLTPPGKEPPQFLIDSYKSTEAVVTLWEFAKDKPQFTAALTSELEDVYDARYREAPLLKDPAVAFSEASARYFNRLLTEWYTGDHKMVTREVSATITEEVVSNAAPSLIVRLPGLRKALDSAYAARLAQAEKESAEALAVLAKFGKKRSANASEDIENLLTTLARLDAGPAGAKLARTGLYLEGGFTKAEQLAIEALAKGEVTGSPVSSYWFGRNVGAARAQAAGAVTKESWVWPKTVKELDVTFFGYDPSDLHLQTWIAPPTKEQVAKRMTDLALTAEQRAVVQARHAQMLEEWDAKHAKMIPSLLRKAEKAKKKGNLIEIEFPLEGNTKVPVPNEQVKRKFRVTEERTGPNDPFGEVVDDKNIGRKKLIPEEYNDATNKWGRITGDHDAMLFTDAYGNPLSDEAHLQVIKYLRSKGIINHPDIGSYRDLALQRKLLFGKKGYQCGPDGKWRRVEHLAKWSDYDNPTSFRHWFKGALVVYR